MGGDMGRAWRLGFLGVLVVAGCAGGEPAGRVALERDSAGITIVTSSPPYPAWQLTDTPTVRIGVREGDPEYEFQNVRHAARLTDGRVVVVDRGSREIRYYSVTGQYQSTVGHKGEGPGEYKEISAVIGEPGYNYMRDTLRLVVFAPPAVDTIAQLPGDEASTWVRYVGGRPSTMMRMGLPFGYRVLTGATEQRLVLATGDRTEIDLLDDSGKLMRVIRRTDVQPTPVSDLDRQRYGDKILANARARGETDEASIRESVRLQLATIPDGHLRPPFDRLLVDAADRIWVRDFVPPWETDQPHAWTVYDADGHVLARVVTPAGLQVMQVGRDHITGIERDELDVQYVAVYGIDRSDRPSGDGFSTGRVEPRREW